MNRYRRLYDNLAALLAIVVAGAITIFVVVGTITVIVLFIAGQVNKTQSDFDRRLNTACEKNGGTKDYSHPYQSPAKVRCMDGTVKILST